MLRACIVICAIAITAQEENPPAKQDASKEVEELKAKQAEQEKKIKELEEKLAALSQEKPDDGKKQQDLKDLKEDLDYLQLQQEGSEKRIKELESRLQTSMSSPNVFNPALTAFINFAARSDSQKVVNDNGVQISNNAYLRSAEIDLRQQIDPYASAVMVLSAETDGEEFAIDVEEAYANITSLPFLSTVWPKGMKMVAGRFKLPFGQLNRTHLHDMMWITRPLPVAEYMTTEGTTFFKEGVSENGMYLDFLLPDWTSPFKDSAPELILGIVPSNQLAITEGTGGKSYAPFARYQFYDVFDNTNEFTLGLNAYYEGTDQLYAVDMVYRWKPQTAGDYKSIIVGTEIFRGKRNVGEESRPFGFTVFLQDQLNKPLYVGARFDSAEAVADEDLVTQVISLDVTYYASEFLRFRAAFERTISDDKDLDGDTAIMLELNVVYGAHPVEPFWVNK